MSNDHEHEHGGADGPDPDIATLLREAGLRPQPPAGLAAEVRAAVEAEWRASVAARRPPRRRPLPWLAAATVAATAVGLAVLLPRWQATAVDVATVARQTGAAELRRGPEAAWQALAGPATLRAGDELRTTAGGRVALQRRDGLELRLDADTTLAFDGTDRARLASGRVYVDAGRSAQADAFVVATVLGNVRHLGTQYSVALAPGALDVAVREGSVAVERGHEPVVARAGERLQVAADGRVTRGTAATRGDAWRWAEAVAPAFAIEGRTLDEFLGWAARETGCQLVYASADAAQAAAGTVLKGSIDGLSPEAAVAAVMTTTPALQHRYAGTQLRIERTRP